MNSIGLTPVPPLKASQTSQSRGPRARTKTTGLAARPESIALIEGPSEIGGEVHVGIERGDLLGVAVEHERVAAEELADAPLRRLAPARMIDRRIDVGIEA